MRKRLSFKEALARREPIPADRPRPSGSPMNAVLRRTAPLTEPVTLAQRLVDAGLSLRKAHEVVTRLAAGADVPVHLPAVADARVLEVEGARLGVAVEWRRPPSHVDVKVIRERLGLTQAEFAVRFGFELDTVQNWEQGRYVPDGPTRTLLRVIERDPKAVEGVLGTPEAA